MHETTVDAEVARLARVHHGLFNIAQLDRLQIPQSARDRRVLTGRWEVVHDQVYRIGGAPPTWKAEVLAACWAGGLRAVASHRSAAALWDLPGGRHDIAEITCPRWRRARHDGLVVHESLLLEPCDIAEIERIPCTTVARTIFDQAGRVAPGTIDLDIDAALRRELVTVEALVDVRDRLATKGRRGAVRFRAVLAGRFGSDGGLPESAPERLLARALVRQGLPEPVAQYVVRDHRDRFVARVDLAYPDQRIVIEYDSYQHHVGKAALVRDSARRNAIVALGFTPVTATADDLRDKGARVARVVRSLLDNNRGCVA
jgi:hypothetical protein